MKKIKFLSNVFMIITFAIYIAGCVLASFYMGTMMFIFSVLTPSVCLVIIFSVGLYQLQQIYINDKMEEIKRIEKLKRLDLQIQHKSMLLVNHTDQLKESKRKLDCNKKGFIYLFEREDSILKIGRAYNPVARLKEHEKDYGQRFKPVALWISDNVFKDENRILDVTKEYSYNEDKRRELRDIGSNKMIEIINNTLKRKTLNQFLYNDVEFIESKIVGRPRIEYDLKIVGRLMRMMFKDKFAHSFRKTPIEYESIYNESLTRTQLNVNFEALNIIIDEMYESKIALSEHE